VLLANVQAIDPSGNRVMIDGGESVPYEYLIVASGAAHAYFGHPEWAQRAPGLKTLDDALEMRRRVLRAFEAAEREGDAVKQRRLLTFVIVGAGPTGVELAGALSEIAKQSLRKDFRRIHPESARVVLLEGGPFVLAPFPEPLRAAARRSLERLGVEVRTGAVVTGIDEDGVLIGSERISAGTVLWAAGVAASPIAGSLGVPLDRAGRVTPEPTLALAAHPNIFVIGDICVFVENGKPLPGVAQVAMQQGTCAGGNIGAPFRGGRSRRSATGLRHHGHHGRRCGRRHLRPEDLGFFAWLFWIFLHIFWLIGPQPFRRDDGMGVGYFSLQRRVRLITASHPTLANPDVAVVASVLNRAVQSLRRFPFTRTFSKDSGGMLLAWTMLKWRA
jgi:NADH dehydrogenase